MKVNSGSPGSCPPLSPLILLRVPNAGPPSWSIPTGPPNPLDSPGGVPPLRGNCNGGGGHTAEALSLFLNLSGLDKMVLEEPVLGPLSFLVSSGGGLHHQDLRIGRTRKFVNERF